MNVLCNACLCSDRTLYPIAQTGVQELYSSILNEVHLRATDVWVCWLCRRQLQRFQQFKRQAQTCQGLIQQCSDYATILTLSKPSRLQLHSAISLSMHTNMCERDNLIDSVPPHTEFTVDIIKQEVDETHCEPEAFIGEVNAEGERDYKDIKERSVSPSCHDDFITHDSDDEVLAKVKQERGEDKKEGGEEILEGGEEKERGAKCEDCGEVFEKARELRTHARKIHSKRKKAKLKTKSNQMKSIDKQNPDPSIDNNISIDTENHKEDSIDDAFGQRVKKTHDCKECEGKFEKLKDLKAHAKEKHAITEEKEQIESRDGKPYCSACDKTFSSNKTYRYHRNVLHLGENRHQCPRCDNVYQWRSNLARHLRTHKARDSGELYCALCDKRFSSVATKTQHMRRSRRHVPEEHFTFKCSECDKKFVTKVSLRDHVDWEHLHKIKFRCNLCHKAFKCHTSMYIHTQNVHRKDKKENLCHVCGKSYQNAAKLKYHIVAMHTLETPHQCAACPAAFGWYSSLYRHVREVHYKMKIQPNRKRKAKKNDPPLPATQPPPV